MTAERHQTRDPRGQEMVRTNRLLEAEGAKTGDDVAGGSLGIEGKVAALEKRGQRAVRAAEIENQHARPVLLRLEQQEVYREGLAGPGAPHEQRVTDIGPAEQVVEITGSIPGLENRQRRSVQMAAESLPLSRPEDRGHRGGRTRRNDERTGHVASAPAGPALEVDGGLSEALADQLSVHLREDARQAGAGMIEGRRRLGGDEHRQGDLSVRNAVRLDLHARIAELAHLGTGRGVLDGQGGALAHDGPRHPQRARRQRGVVLALVEIDETVEQMQDFGRGQEANRGERRDERVERLPRRPGHGDGRGHQIAQVHGQVRLALACAVPTTDVLDDPRRVVGGYGAVQLRIEDHDNVGAVLPNAAMDMCAALRLREV